MPGNATFVRQQEPLGRGNAGWCAREIVGNEPFTVFLPDEFMVGSPGCMKQMVDAYENVGGNLICALEEIGRAHVLTPVTNAHLVCRLLLEKKKKTHSRQKITERIRTQINKSKLTQSLYKNTIRNR